MKHFSLSGLGPLPSGQRTKAPFGTLLEKGADFAAPQTMYPLPPHGNLTPEPERDPSARVRVEGYDILGELGRGNMGVVYKARHLQLNRTVALKMVRTGAHAGAEEIDRFLEEARVVALLQHPNIVRVYDVGVHDGLPYFSMEYVEGGNLDERLGGRPLPSRRAAAIVHILAQAIQTAHQNGIVHRDLKPANILVADEPGASTNGRFDLDGWVPKVTDFGLAKQLEGGSSQTVSGMIMGTPNYMAPEQAEGRSRDVGPAADVYALGAILYECLTGRPPYNAESPAETVLQIFNSEPVPPSRLEPKIPRDIETICLKCLQKDPARRYASAQELAQDLERFLLREPIAARPIGHLEKTWTWAKRHRALASAAASLLIGAVAFLGLMIYHQFDLRDQLDVALQQERSARANEEETQLRIRRSKAEARIGELLRAAEVALGKKDWALAQVDLVQARSIAGQDPELPSLKGQAESLLANTVALKKERDDFDQFVALRNEALFQGTLYTASDLAGGLEKTRTAARAALAIYPVSRDATAERGPSPMQRSLTDQEQSLIASGCFELTLVLAEAIAQPLPEQDPKTIQQLARAALTILEESHEIGASTRAYHLRRAKYLRQAGDAAEAEQAHKHALTLQPATAVDGFLVGADAYRRGDWADATVHLQNALQHQPDHFWSHYYLALVYLKTHQPSRAIDRLTACLSQRPDFAWLYLLRGSAWLEQERTAEAEGDFDRAIKLPLDPQAEFGLLINRGVLRVKQRRAAEAVDDLTRAVALQPNLYQGHLNLAQAYQTLGQTEAALSQLQEALRCEPKMALLYHLRARLWIRKGDVAAALADLDRAVSLWDPAEPGRIADDQFERAKLLLQGGNKEAALEALEHAPQLAPALRLKAETLLVLHRYPQAVAALDACLHLAPAAELFRARGATQARLGKYSHAIADYGRAIEVSPDAGTHVTRGWLHAVVEAPKLALLDFEAALKRDPNHAEARVGRGYALVLLKDVDAGLAEVERSLQKESPSARHYFLAARAFARAGTHELRAVDLLTRALEALPRDRWAEFWNSTIAVDGELASLRNTRAYAELRLAATR